MNNNDLGNIKNLKIYTDGGARGNPGPGAAAFVVFVDNEENPRHKCGKYLGETTNNAAEYQGVLMALEWLGLTRERPLQVFFYLDSLLIVNQMNGFYKVKDAKLRQLYVAVQNMVFGISQKGTRCRFSHIPRSRNKRADFLVNKVLDEAKL